VVQKFNSKMSLDENMETSDNKPKKNRSHAKNCTNVDSILTAQQYAGDTTLQNIDS